MLYKRNKNNKYFTFYHFILANGFDLADKRNYSAIYSFHNFRRKRQNFLKIYKIISNPSLMC